MPETIAISSNCDKASIYTSPIYPYYHSTQILAVIFLELSAELHEDWLRIHIHSEINYVGSKCDIVQTLSPTGT